MEIEAGRSERPWLSAAGVVGLMCWVAVLMDLLGWLNLWVMVVAVVASVVVLHRLAPRRPKPHTAGGPTLIAGLGAAAAFVYIHSHSSFVPLSGSADYGLNVRLTDAILGEHRLHRFTGKIDEMRHYPWGAHLLAATLARTFSIETARALWLVTLLAFVLLAVSATSLVISAAGDLALGKGLALAAPATIVVILAAGHYTLAPIMASYFFAQYVVIALTIAAVARSAACPDGSTLELCLMGSGLVFVYTNQALVGLLALAVIEVHRGRNGNWRRAGRRLGALICASTLAAAFIAPSVLSTRLSATRLEGVIAGVSPSRLGGPAAIALAALGLVICLSGFRPRGASSAALLILAGSAALYFVANAMLEHPLGRTSRYNTIKSFYPLVAASLPLAGLAVVAIWALILQRKFRSLVLVGGLGVAVILCASANRFVKPIGPGITLAQITFMRRVAAVAPVQSISFAAPGTLPYVLAVGFGGYPKDGSELMLLTKSSAPPTDYLLILNRKTLPPAVLAEAARLRLVLRVGEMELRSRSSAVERARLAIRPRTVDTRWEEASGSLGTSDADDELPTAVSASAADLLLRNRDRRPQRVRLTALAAVASRPCTLAVSFDGVPIRSSEVAPAVGLDLHLTLPTGLHSVGFRCVRADETHPFAVNVVRLSVDANSSSTADSAPDSTPDPIALVEGLPGWSARNAPDVVSVAAPAPHADHEPTDQERRSALTVMKVLRDGGSVGQDLYAGQDPSDRTSPASSASAIEAGRRVSARVLLRNQGAEPANVTLALWSLCAIPTNDNVSAIVPAEWRSVNLTTTSKGCPMRVELYAHPPGGRTVALEVAPLVVSIDD